jgi:hypothetical protein
MAGVWKWVDQKYRVDWVQNLPIPDAPAVKVPKRGERLGGRQDSPRHSRRHAAAQLNDLFAHLYATNIGYHARVVR